MKVLGASLLSAVVLTAAVLGVIHLSSRAAPSGAEPAHLWELAALRQELQETQDRIAVLEETLHLLASQPPSATGGSERHGAEDPDASAPNSALTSENGLSKSTSEAVAPKHGNDGAPPPEILRPYSTEMRDYVFSLIEDERRIREENQRQRTEEFRRELEELRQGPYERFNVKVNSMAKLLDMDDRQRDRYYEVSKAYYDDLQALRKDTKWQDSESRRRYKTDHDRIQTEYNRDVAGLLTDGQLKAYEELPTWSRSINHLGRVTASSERGTTIRYNLHSSQSNGVIRIDR